MEDVINTAIKLIESERKIEDLNIKIEIDLLKMILNELSKELQTINQDIRVMNLIIEKRKQNGTDSINTGRN